jgi:hypothetical protein
MSTKLFHSFFFTLLAAALLAGTLDMIGATLQFILNGGREPGRIWRYVASGAFGPSARKGGTEMVVYGLLFHYFIAFTWTLIFFLVFSRLGFAIQFPILAGVLYGILVWLGMNFVVVPLSHIGSFPVHLKSSLIGAGILVLAIGIPVSLMAHRYNTGRT